MHFNFIAEPAEKVIRMFTERNEKYFLERFTSANGGDPKQGLRDYQDYINWRKTHHLNIIRRDILQHGLSKPSEFPYGKKILKAVPMLLIAFNGLNASGLPLMSKTYGYGPEFRRNGIKKREFIQFMLYVVEYKTMVLEQLSHGSRFKFVNTIPMSALPKAFGGTAKEEFVFDLSESGPFPLYLLNATTEEDNSPEIDYDSSSEVAFTENIMKSGKSIPTTSLTVALNGHHRQQQLQQQQKPLVGILRRGSSETTVASSNTHPPSVNVTSSSSSDQNKRAKLFSRKAILRFFGFGPNPTPSNTFRNSLPVTFREDISIEVKRCSTNSTEHSDSLRQSPRGIVSGRVSPPIATKSTSVVDKEKKTKTKKQIQFTKSTKIDG